MRTEAKRDSLRENAPCNVRPPTQQRPAGAVGPCCAGFSCRRIPSPDPPAWSAGFDPARMPIWRTVRGHATARRVAGSATRCRGGHARKFQRALEGRPAGGVGFAFAGHTASSAEARHQRPIACPGRQHPANRRRTRCERGGWVSISDVQQCYVRVSAVRLSNLHPTLGSHPAKKTSCKSFHPIVLGSFDLSVCREHVSSCKIANDGNAAKAAGKHQTPRDPPRHMNPSSFTISRAAVGSYEELTQALLQTGGGAVSDRDRQDAGLPSPACGTHAGEGHAGTAGKNHTSPVNPSLPL